MSNSSLLSQAKIFGGLGSILMLLVVIPFIGVVIFLIGLVLVLVALKYISDEVDEPRIFRYALISLVILGVSVISAIMIFALMSFFVPPSMGYVKKIIAPVSGREVTTISAVYEFRMSLESMLIPFLIPFILVILFIISSIFIKKSFDLVASKLGVNLFSVVGLLYLIGSILTVIAVGLIIIYVAIIIQIIAFFLIPERSSAASQEVIKI